MTFVKVNLDRDDGRMVYDVDFYSGNAEYDYEIDAATGDIVGYDSEIENFDIQAQIQQAGDRDLSGSGQRGGAESGRAGCG